GAGRSSEDAARGADEEVRRVVRPEPYLPKRGVVGDAVVDGVAVRADRGEGAIATHRAGQRERAGPGGGARFSNAIGHHLRHDPSASSSLTQSAMSFSASCSA